MFHAPHDQQVILKISGVSDVIKKANLGSQPKLSPSFETKPPAATAAKLFTLVPEPFDLVKVADGSLASFTAKVYDGHFEKGGISIGSAKVQVEKVIFSKKLTANHAPSFDYLVFGENKEFYAAHIIGGKPSFDQITKVAQPYYLFEKHCRARVCPQVKVPVPDSELPLKVSYHDLMSDKWAPESGDYLSGGLSGPATSVLEVIYIEVNELSF